MSAERDASIERLIDAAAEETGGNPVRAVQLLVGAAGDLQGRLNAQGFANPMGGRNALVELLDASIGLAEARDGTATTVQ